MYILKDFQKGDVEMSVEEEKTAKRYIDFCEENCNRKVTKEDVFNSINCNFCDVPYILLYEENIKLKNGE